MKLYRLIYKGEKVFSQSDVEVLLSGWVIELRQPEQMMIIN
jgi:hypothetical protein